MFTLLIPLDARPANGIDSLFSHPVSITDPGKEFNAVTDDLANNQVIRGRFSQERRFKVLKRPLLSEGYYLFASGKGLYWQIERPLQVSYVITEDSITEYNQDQKNANVQGVKWTKFIAAIVSGNITSLADQFNIYFLSHAEDWSIGLVPQGGPLADHLKLIRLTGVRYVEEITIEAENGDTTKLRLSGIETKPDFLTDEETAYFDP